ncbi:MAG: sensor histidine kinase [Clostridia bacterium]|nr:sensor histidine kinase [Clostridia bacterium]
MSKLNLRFYIAKYRLNSVFLRNLIMIILIITIPFGLSCVVVYRSSVSAAKNETRILARQQMDKMAASLDIFIKSMDKMCIVILQQPDVEQIFSTSESVLSLSGNYMTIMDELNMFTLSYGYIKNIQVYSDLNHCIVSQVAVNNADNDTSGMLAHYRNAGDGLYVTASDSNGTGIKTVTFMRTKKVGEELLGAVSIEVNIERLFKELGISYNDFNDRFMLIDSGNKVLLSSYLPDINMQSEEISGEDVQTVNIDGTEYLVTRAPAAAGDWEYTHIYNEAYYVNANSRMVRMSVILFFFVLIMSVVIAVYISTKTFRPLAEIVEYFYKEETAQHGDNNELGYIIRNIMSLASENVNLTEEMQKRIMMMNKAQLQALQNQINPHFIYNTLETIKWVVMDLEDNGDEASSMIEMLADVISYSMNMEQYLVDLEKEIQYTKTYISILKIRFGDRFCVDWDIDPELQHVQVLKLCLQPLIENAMVHGIVPKRKSGTIRISVKAVKKDICIEVADDGVGIDADKLKELKSGLDGSQNGNSKHIGLKNVNLRTRLVFGEEYGISVLSEKGAGTRVTLLMKKQMLHD